MTAVQLERAFLDGRAVSFRTASLHTGRLADPPPWEVLFAGVAERSWPDTAAFFAVELAGRRRVFRGQVRLKRNLAVEDVVVFEGVGPLSQSQGRPEDAASAGTRATGRRRRRGRVVEALRRLLGG